MKLAHVIAGLGVVTIAAGLTLTFYSYGEAGSFAIACGLFIALMGLVGSQK